MRGLAKRRPRTGWLVPAAAAGAMVLTVVLTRHGALLDPDSTAYLASARLFRAHPSNIWSPPSGTALSIRGLFPPGYPMLLALVAPPHHELGAARWLGVVLAGVTFAALARILRDSARPVAAVAALVLVALSRSYVLVLFGFLMSEGLHAACAVLAVVALVPLFDRAEGAPLHRRAALAGIASAGAFATRWVGIGVVAAVVVTLAWVVPGARRERARAAALAGLLGAIPAIAWNVVVGASGSSGDRHLGVQHLDRTTLWAVADYPASHLPRQVIDALGATGNRLVGAVVLLTALVWSCLRIAAATRGGATPGERTTAALALVAWGHLGALVGARALYDQQVPLSGRHAMVWLVCLVPAVAIDLDRRALASGPVGRRWRRASIVAAAFLAFGAMPAFVRALAEPVQAWSNLAQQPPSELAGVAAQLADGRTVYTNREDQVYLRTQRLTARLPLPQDMFTGRANAGYDEQVARMAREVRAGRAIVALFEFDPLWSVPVPTLLRQTGLTVIERTDEGVILGP